MKVLRSSSPWVIALAIGVLVAGVATAQTSKPGPLRHPNAPPPDLGGPPPPNDDCVNAIAVACNSTVAGNTDTAAADTDPGFCGTTFGTPGVWYTVTGSSGGDITATTCFAGAGTDYDTKLNVYTDGCGTLTCIGGNDDQLGAFDPACDTTGIGFNRGSTLTWAGANGREDIIFVGGFAGATGNFVLGVDCAIPVEVIEFEVE